MGRGARAAPKSAPKGGAKRIRVVEAARKDANILLLPPEELRANLEALAGETDPALREPILGIEHLVGALKALDRRGPGGDYLGLRAAPPPPGMAEVALRQLLYTEAIRPVVPPRRPGPPEEPPEGALRVRPGAPTPAYTTEGRGVALAAEEGAVVVGLAVDRARVGALIPAVLGGAPPRPFGAYAASGGYAAPALSVARARAEAPANPFPSRLGAPAAAAGPVAYHPLTPRLVAVLRREVGRALAYHLGAGAVLALAAARARAAPLGTGPLAALVAPPPTRGLAPSGGPEALVGERARHLIGRLAEVLPGLTAAPEEFVFFSAPLLDIHRAGAGEVFYAVLTRGRDAPAARRFLERAGARARERAQRRRLERALFAEVARARQLMLIVEDTLGPARAAAAKAALLRAGGLDSPERVLGVLPRGGRALVANEYERRRLEWESQVGNKCPHVALAFRLRRARTAREAAEILGRLEEYAKPGAWARTGAWAMCRSCGHRLLCPHVRDRIAMEARRLPYDRVRAGLMKYAVRYSDRAPGGGAFTTYSYFCRICSERLSEFTREDRTAERLGAVGELDDPTRKAIWVEAVRAAALVRFPAPVDPRHFARTAAEVCHPLLLRAEGALLRRGARRAPAPARGAPGPPDPYGAEGEVEPRLRLYAVLFVYAYVLNLIRSSRAGARPLGFEGVRPGAKMSRYARAILDAVLRKNGGLVARIEDVTPEFIAERFREAYRLVVGAHGAQALAGGGGPRDLVRDVVDLDPVYRYAAMAARVFGPLPLARPATPREAGREFETAVGVPLARLLRPRRAEKESELVRRLLGLRPGGRRAVVDYPPGADPEFVYGEAEVNFYAALFEIPPAALKGFEAGAFDRLAAVSRETPHPARLDEFVVGGRARKKTKPKAKKTPKAKPKTKKTPKTKKKPKAKKTKKTKRFDPGMFARSPHPHLSAAMGPYLSGSYRLFAEYTKVASRPAWKAFQGRLAAFRERERGLLLLRAAARRKNALRVVFAGTRRYDPRAEARPITRIYDEDGAPHSWARGGGSIYVYAPDDGGGPPLELTAREVAARTAAALAAKAPHGPLHGHRLADVRCATCRALLSEVGALDRARTRTSLQARSEFAAFYAFYRSRCPVEGLHEFAADRCGKCGMAEALIYGHSGAALAAPARAYYDKYSGRYHEQRGQAKSSAGLLAPEAPPPEAEAPFRAYAEKWKYDYGQVVRAAELTGVPVAALEALGATEGRMYSAVLAGGGAPPPPSSADDPRLLAVDSDVRLFTTEYNRLRFISRFSALPPPDLELLEGAGVPQHEFEALPGALPEVFDDYRAKRAAMLRHRPPADALLFMVEALARMAVRVASAGGGGAPPWLAPLGRAFASRAVQGIVRSERLLAKNGPFNFKIFGDDDIRAGLAGDGEVAGGPAEDVLEELEARAGEDGAPDAFKHDAVDVEGEVLEANL